MAIKLAQDSAGNTPYTIGTGVTPITVSVTMPVDADTPKSTSNTIFVVADDDTTNIDNYSGISVALESEETGIDWEVSTNNTAFANSINLSDMDVSSSAQYVQIYARCTVASGKATANYTAAKIKLTATENPVA